MGRGAGVKRRLAEEWGEGVQAEEGGQSRAGSALAGIQEWEAMLGGQRRSLMGSESNPELDAQPPEDSEGRLHILVV